LSLIEEEANEVTELKYLRDAALDLSDRTRQYLIIEASSRLIAIRAISFSWSWCPHQTRL
jgi:hypothetical protein